MRTALLVLVLSGCATQHAAHFVDDATLKFDASRYADDAAVVLLREDRTQLVSGNIDHTKFSRHEVIAVLGEGGRWLGQVKIPFNSKATFADFSARIIRPDGTKEVFTDTALLSDTSGKGERDSNARFFTFPNVSVGCILEYDWSVDSQGTWQADEQDTLGNYPVKQYRFELTASKPLQLDTIEMNGTAPIETRTGNDGSHTLRFELRDLPARSDTDAEPNWTFTEPRWAWRVLAYKATVTYDWMRDWKDVVKYRGDAFFTEGKLQRGFDVKLDTTDCNNATCWADRALQLVKKKTVSRGVDWNRSENINDAWKSGKASGVERALMVRELLVAQGLDVWLAYGTGKLNRQAMPTFPNLSQFDRLFVYVPIQRGVQQAMTLDPACNACTATQTELEYVGVPVFVFKTTAPLGTTRTEGRWERPWLDPAPSSYRIAHTAKLVSNGGPYGDIFDDVTYEGRGPEAADFVENHSSSKFDLMGDSRSRARGSSPTAEVETALWDPCNDEVCGWHVSVKFPAEALKDGERFLVPTTFLRGTLEEYLLANKRQVDLHFKLPDHFEEVAELRVPENLKLVSVPAPVSLNVDGLKVAVKFEPTPNGVRITRQYSHDVLAISKDKYESVQAAVEAFRRARREVLVFTRKQ
jgi:hypothetical protein